MTTKKGTFIYKQKNSPKAHLYFLLSNFYIHNGIIGYLCVSISSIDIKNKGNYDGSCILYPTDYYLIKKPSYVYYKKVLFISKKEYNEKKELGIIKEFDKKTPNSLMEKLQLGAEKTKHLKILFEDKFDDNFKEEEYIIENIISKIPTQSLKDIISLS